MVVIGSAHLMKHIHLTVLSLFCLAGIVEAEKPNVLLIMADDLGYSDLGCYGGEIETPNLNGLAQRGLRFTQFYNTARCWPTRGALLTGYYAQQIRRDAVPGLPSGGRGTRQPWAQLLPNYLKPLGYRSYHSGKWHIDGMPIEQDLIDRITFGIKVASSVRRFITRTTRSWPPWNGTAATTV